MYSITQIKKVCVCSFLIISSFILSYFIPSLLVPFDKLVIDSDYTIEKTTEFKGVYTQGLEYKFINSKREVQVSQGSAVNEINIIIPDYWNGSKVTSIGEFNKCNSLESITIPLGIKSIEDYAFYNCINLSKITIPAKVTFIGECAFYKSGIKSIDMKPIQSPSLGLYCFQYTKVLELNIPVVSSGYDSFPWNNLSQI